MSSRQYRESFCVAPTRLTGFHLLYGEQSSLLTEWHRHGVEFLKCLDVYQSSGQTTPRGGTVQASLTAVSVARGIGTARYNHQRQRIARATRAEILGAARGGQMSSHRRRRHGRARRGQAVRPRARGEGVRQLLHGTPPELRALCRRHQTLRGRRAQIRARQHRSSSSVYGAHSFLPEREELIHPISPCGVSGPAAEQ